MHPKSRLWSTTPNDSSFSNRMKSGTMKKEINRNIHIWVCF